MPRAIVSSVHRDMCLGLDFRIWPEVKRSRDNLIHMDFMEKGGQCVQVLAQTHLHLAICKAQTINPGRQWPIVQAPQKPMSCSYLESTTAAKFSPPSHEYIQSHYYHAPNSNSLENIACSNRDPKSDSIFALAR